MKDETEIILPKRLERETVYESEWIKLYIDKVLMPSGRIIEQYYQLDYPSESVVVLLVNKNKEICFIKSLRYTSQTVEWELPAGHIENNEDALEAGKREVFEETGLKSDNLKLIMSYNPSNGMSNQEVHVLFGEAVNTKQTDFDTDEVKSVHWLSIGMVKDLIVKNEIKDGISLIPLLLYLGGIY